jgi:hypothetical protein
VKVPVPVIVALLLGPDAADPVTVTDPVPDRLTVDDFPTTADAATEPVPVTVTAPTAPLTAELMTLPAPVRDVSTE